MNKITNILNKASNICLILLGIVFTYQSIMGEIAKFSSTSQILLGGVLFLVGINNIMIKDK